ncbi:MAG: hypothetical protein M1840_007387 [Geoglossum simile]|nr:MAG: hypothetical protein M1840_007387 [Geoglossum simile]
MPLNTLTYIHKKDLINKPTEHISYHEGLRLIRRFLLYASNYTVEDVQAFTSQWVPVPHWVRVEEVIIPLEWISESAEAIQQQLGERGIRKVGGRTWWQWRKEGSPLKAEWIEMKKDYNERIKTGDKCKRVMLYVHGGAYFFGSVDEHRYQMQRHARKLQARVFARVCGDHSLDFIPAHGFLQKPSLSWPPPHAGELATLSAANTEFPESTREMQRPKDHQEAQTSTIGEDSKEGGATHPRQKSPSDSTLIDTSATLGHNISITIDGSIVPIKDQIQMYTTNELLYHPLVSPVLQPSLGGFPPLLVLTGGGEVLRDEQIYLAHKAANPTKYPPGDRYLDEDPTARETLAKWKPTDVQLQVWDNCCHATPALSFTPPAKHMYRSIAQFAAWALAHAQQTEIEILDDDDISIISSNSDSSSTARRSSKRKLSAVASPQAPTVRVGRAGDPLPPFHNHMIRQRVGRHGVIYDLGPESDLPGLSIPPSEVGVIKPEPVRRWIEGKKTKEKQFAPARHEIQKQRAREITTGFEWPGENPPPSALAGRRKKDWGPDPKKKKSWGMSLWSLWGSIHDEKTLQREEKADNSLETATIMGLGGARARSAKARRSRSRSRRRTVSDAGQASGDISEGVAAEIAMRGKDQDPNYLESPTVPTIAITEYSELRPEQGSRQNAKAGRRPFEGPVAYPFKLALQQGGDPNASTTTLISEAGVLDSQSEGGIGATERE